MKILFLSLFSILFFNLNAQVKNDKVVIEPGLKNELFNKDKVINDSIWLGTGMDHYFGMPINANVKISGDFAEIIDTLNLCECARKKDSLFIYITLPVVCCYRELIIKVSADQFTTNYYCSYDVSPGTVRMLPVKQKLKFSSAKYMDDEIIKGYVYFDGTGHYTFSKASVNPDVKLEESDKSKLFKGKAQGYFKCKVSR